MIKTRIHVPILLYHRIVQRPDGSDPYSVTAAQFDRQLNELSKQGFTSTSLPELFASWAGGSVYLPKEKQVVITFDDGTRDNYTWAFPILQKYGFQATIFMLPRFAGQTDESTGTHYLSWDEIMAMRDAGCSFQSHGLSHRAMTGLTQEALTEELKQSKQILSEALAAPVDYLAYPFGQYDDRVQAAVKQAGYKGACGGTPYLDGGFRDPFAIGRTEIFKTDSMAHFRFKLAHGHGGYIYIKKELGRFLRTVGLKKEHT